ncbi:MAG: hypothetical protein AAGF24_14770 [Cyanobacteria bacterium P01_H01_bin.121]
MGQQKTWFKRVKGSIILGLGYLLSPLSWWNDLVFNFPIAAAFGWCIARLQPEWFWPATIVGYWLSNILGIVMMQIGATDTLLPNRDRNWRAELAWSLGGATLYSVVIAGLVYWHILDLPTGF